MLTLLFLLLTGATAAALWSKREGLSLGIFSFTLILAVIQFYIDMDTALTLSF